MTKWKAYAVFFTLLFFSSIRGTLYVYFSTSDEISSNRVIWLILAFLINLLLLYFAVRCWRKSFRADKSRPE